MTDHELSSLTLKNVMIISIFGNILHKAPNHNIGTDLRRSITTDELYSTGRTPFQFNVKLILQAV